MTVVNGLKPINASSLREEIEKQILSAIVRGAIAPGEHIAESVIAEQLGVSRAPVREALTALEGEGIVVYHSRRGHFLVNFSEKDVREIYGLRLILEIGALQRVIANCSEKDIASLQEIVDTLGQAVNERQDYLQISTIDLSFHQRICRLADNRRLFSAWNSMRLQTWLLIGLTSKTEYEYPEQPREFHQEILNAIRDRDIEQAEKLLREHILDAQKRALTNFINQS